MKIKDGTDEAAAASNRNSQRHGHNCNYSSTSIHEHETMTQHETMELSRQRYIINCLNDDVKILKDDVQDVKELLLLFMTTLSHNQTHQEVNEDFREAISSISKVTITGGMHHTDCLQAKTEHHVSSDIECFREEGSNLNTRMGGDDSISTYLVKEASNVPLLGMTNVVGFINDEDACSLLANVETSSSDDTRCISTQQPNENCKWSDNDLDIGEASIASSSPIVERCSSLQCKNGDDTENAKVWQEGNVIEDALTSEDGLPSWTQTRPVHDNTAEAQLTVSNIGSLDTAINFRPNGFDMDSIDCEIVSRKRARNNRKRQKRRKKKAMTRQSNTESSFVDDASVNVARVFSGGWNPPTARFIILISLALLVSVSLVLGQSSTTVGNRIELVQAGIREDLPRPFSTMSVSTQTIITSSEQTEEIPQSRILQGADDQRQIKDHFGNNLAMIHLPGNRKQNFQGEACPRLRQVDHLGNVYVSSSVTGSCPKSDWSPHSETQLEDDLGFSTSKDPALPLEDEARECPCMPPCGVPNEGSCGCPSFFQAHECCPIDEDGVPNKACRCEYLKEACRISLENGQELFCPDAEVACCDAEQADFESCRCDFLEGMCSESPSSATCDHAAKSCCGSTDQLLRLDEEMEYNRQWASTQCQCDFYTYTSAILGFGNDTAEITCSAVEEYQATNKDRDKAALQKLFEATGGYSWINKNKWLDAKISHCQWHGISCNKEGEVTGINLRYNNLKGSDISIVASFPKLELLDLSGNKLEGQCCGGKTNATKFYKLRNLTHIDLSKNKFDGHAGLYFGPQIKAANYSNNLFGSASFNVFNPASNSMEVVDLRNNGIEMRAKDFFQNIPMNLTDLVLSNNTLAGMLPNPFPSLEKLERFAVDNNDLEGMIPYDIVGFVDLAVLDLANNKFSAELPPGIGYLEKLTLLNVSSNTIRGSIPESLGRLEGIMETLDISNNRFSGRIPAEIGNLQGSAVLVGGNLLIPPAPVRVCKIPTVMDDEELCPPEIKILEEFFYHFNGPEWKQNDYWLDDQYSYCDWYGVSCDALNVSTTKLELGSNGLSGELNIRIIEKLSGLKKLETLDLSGNDITGTIPTEISSISKLKELNLSNQQRGLVGTIPDEIVQLLHLNLLDLGGNQLSETIPWLIGNMERLTKLNLSNNIFSHSIPSELGRLQASIENLDLSGNNLDGQIPVELGKLEDIILYLSSNEKLDPPAPLPICLSDTADLINDELLCPPERNILHYIYTSAKGTEWTQNDLWDEDIVDHCTWYGVKCNEEDKVIELRLRNNGLSGVLDPRISGLPMLQYLDVSDNAIQGSMPSSIRLLENLSYLRLSYNLFSGSVPNFGENLRKLEQLQLHGNRLSGSISSLEWSNLERSSLVADCGHPSDFTESLGCEECTMCCNNEGDCYPQEETEIQSYGFNDYFHFTWILFAGIFSLSFLAALIAYIFDRFVKGNRRAIRATLVRKISAVDNEYALEKIGQESVYGFFLGKSWAGWTIFLMTVLAQFWMLFLFVQGAEIDLSSDSTDLVYTWKCTRDTDECRDTADLTWQGWIAFTILMFSHLFKEVINGSKMILFSGKARHDTLTRIRYFVGGLLSGSVNLFTFYVSAIYNAAIATSNTEIIVNAVVISFITDVDEFLYDILMAINEGLVHRMSIGGKDPVLPDTKKGAKDTESMLKDMNLLGGSWTDGSGFDGNHDLEEVVRRLARKVETLNQTIINMANQNPELNIDLNERGSTYQSDRSSESDIESWEGEVPSVPIEDENAELDAFSTPEVSSGSESEGKSEEEERSVSMRGQNQGLNTYRTSTPYSSRYSHESGVASEEERSWNEAVSLIGSQHSHQSSVDP